MKFLLPILVFILAFGSLQEVETLSAVDLGQRLFFDPILSRDQSLSCASCHKPEYAYADNRAFSLGVGDSLGERNAPSIMNMLVRPYFFYDGRAPSLEQQALVPIQSHIEMDLPFAAAVQRIQEDKRYNFMFRQVYGNPPDSLNILDALAEFQRSLESDGSAPHDVWINGIDSLALTASQRRGHAIFIADEFKCFECHFGPDFTGDEFRNIGLYDGLELADVGRFAITQDSSDLGRFKVPGLRNVGLTAPYMHNGMFQTLEEVVDYYSDPAEFVQNPINADTLLQEPLNFSDQQKQDLVNFLHSLTDVNIPFR